MERSEQKMQGDPLGQEFHERYYAFEDEMRREINDHKIQMSRLDYTGILSKRLDP